MNDIPQYNERINFYPYWGAFYWVTKGYLVLKQDSAYVTTTASVADPTKDPC